ncbi:LacI family DNA-binding transcriptional regulator [Hymenobacter sp. GOD-10R]|uniref:LacI family DNA-binding transcriptional regulator n=1 Tax=Hymenobacter sp. GOD-10R TaxID=3093922 RepID=UPI002D7A3C47|nr:LacI family DNA-binding transcriptional regulator [Hymenobacter sp. GOD-10R]WRQ28313.1 LacI family DNA-binding transcriptional regulator [Hymenobacter sp. GOD-10R]
MKKKILIHDIAKHLDVSIATVSLVLNGKAKEKRISDGLAEKVLKYVEEVGYKPNQLAKSLRTGKTHVIGLVVEDIANPFFATIAGLIEKKALAHGYRIIYCSTSNDVVKTRDILAMFQERHVDGYILALPDGLESEVSALVRSGKPLVLFDRVLAGVLTNAVVVDGATGTYEATQHLLAQGLTSVALLTIRDGQTQMIARQQGYTQALREHNLPELVEEIVFQQSPEQVMEQMLAFFQANSACNGVLFTTNYLGVYGLEVLKRLGRRIPEDMAVISFDDNDLFRLYTPPITVVAQPMEAMAEEIISMLLAALNGSKETSRMTQLQLAPQLVLRQSSVTLAATPHLEARTS